MIRYHEQPTDVCWKNCCSIPENTGTYILSRAAMLARHMLSSCVCPSVRPSITSRYYIETTRWIELVLAWTVEASFDLC